MKILPVYYMILLDALLQTTLLGQTDYNYQICTVCL